MKILAIDPGESIGLCWKDGLQYHGMTIKGDYRLSELYKLLDLLKPVRVVYEEFALRQGAALKLVGNKFITCEVLGVVKLWMQNWCMTGIPLQPSNKEFCGFSSNPKDPHYALIQMGPQKITEHVRDAFRLLKYAEMFKGV